MGIKKQSKAANNSAKPGPTTLRQTRARSQLQHAPPLMRGLDHRGRAAEPLPTDPEQIPYGEVLQKLEGARRQQRSAAPEPDTPAQSANSSGQESQTLTTESVSQDPLDDEVDEGDPMDLDEEPEEPEEPEDLVDWASTPDTTSQFPVDYEEENDDNGNPAVISVLVMVNSEPAQWVSKVPGKEILRREIAWPGSPAADFLSLDTIDSVKERRTAASDAGSSKDAPPRLDTSPPTSIHTDNDINCEESPLFVTDHMWDDQITEVTDVDDGSSSGRKRKRSVDEDDVSPKTIKHVRLTDSTDCKDQGPPLAVKAAKPVKHVRFTDSTDFKDEEPPAVKADVGNRFEHIYFRSLERKTEAAPFEPPQVNPGVSRKYESCESDASETPEESISSDLSDDFPTSDDETLYEPAWQMFKAFDPEVRSWEAEEVEHAQDKGLSPFGKAGKIRAHPDWYEQYHRFGPDCIKVHACECIFKLHGNVCPLCHDDWLQQWEIFYYDEENPTEAKQIIDDGSTATLEESSKSTSERQTPFGGTVRFHPSL